MSDLENKLRSLAFREPPKDLRRRVLAASAAPRWTWRDWLWPSPIAWGALAAVWLVALATSQPTSPAENTSDRALFALAARYHHAIELDLK